MTKGHHASHLTPLCILLVTGVLICAGCGGSRSSLSNRNAGASFASRTVFVPAGVDTSVAVLADSLSQETFVPFEQEEQARLLAEDALRMVQQSDSLWKILEMTRDDGYTVSREDSIQSIESFNEAAVAYQEAAQLQGGDPQALMARQVELLDLAQLKFEEAVTYNPFDEQARALLARVYLLQYNRLKREGAVDKSIEILERLTRVEKGRHEFFSELGSAYYSRENWEMAAVNYVKAETALLEARATDVNAANPGTLSPEDSSALFNYAYYHGESSAFMYDAPTAMAAFERARSYASSPAELEVVDGVVEWIQWDGGNIQASEKRDEIALLEAQDLQAAESAYGALLPTLSTQPARDEINWKLALVEANLGKTESAVVRLKHLVDRAPKRTDGTPEDPQYSRYFDAYGTLCYNLASENLREQRDKRSALTYYLQSASIAWENRARAYLEAAKILQNNTPEAIAYAVKGLEASPTEDDLKSLYALLVSLHRRAGNQNEARRYFNLHRALN